MLLPVLITIFIILGSIFLYIYYIAPNLNPLNKAENYLAMNMVDEAIREYKKILDKKPSEFLVHYKLAELYFKIDELDQGVLHLERILQINKYNYEVEKVEVLRRLGKSYLVRNEMDRAFEMYYEILKSFPLDQESLYHVSFIALGQELFDLARRSFTRLASQKKSFDIFFGSGIACYQVFKTDDAISYFKDALGIDPHSDIGNLAMAFALYRRKDYKTAINFAKMIIENSKNDDAIFIAKRLTGFLFALSRKFADGVKMFEDILGYARKKEMPDEIMSTLYDLGFACIKAEQTDQGYEYWNELYEMDRGYKNVQSLVMILRKEMDISTKMQPRKAESVVDYYEGWVSEAFHPDFLWRICGLKSSADLDLKRIISVSKPTAATARSDLTFADYKSSEEAYERLEKFIKLDNENFRIISNRVVSKLGYSVDEILQTYREADGVDFLAKSTEDKNLKVLVWVRRWTGIQVGEIPLRNFAQAINDAKVSHGFFITAAELTPAGENAATRLSKVNLILPDRLAELLDSLI